MGSAGKQTENSMLTVSHKGRKASLPAVPQKSVVSNAPFKLSPTSYDAPLPLNALFLKRINIFI